MKKIDINKFEKIGIIILTKTENSFKTFAIFRFNNKAKEKLIKHNNIYINQSES